MNAHLHLQEKNMSTPVNLQVDTLATGRATVFAPLTGKVAPPSTLVHNTFIGQQYVNTVTGNVYVLTSYTSSGGKLAAVWSFVGGATGSLDTLSDTTGTTVTPSGGNIQLAGTANEITVTAGSNKLTWTLPSAITAPGSLATTTTLTAGTTLTATLGAITATNGNLVLGTAGNKIVSSHVGTTTTAGANSFGSVALVGGTATVDTSAVTANSLIFLTCQALGTVIVASGLAVTTITASMSFVITASQGTDTSTIAWMVIN